MRARSSGPYRDPAAAEPGGRVPGRSTLTSRLAPRSPSMASMVGAVADAVVQRLGRGGVHADDPSAVAAQGLDGASAALPHLDAIQRSFGRHDVSAVRTAVGGAAADASAALGAHAYASGGAVAFASSPDLFMAAHEAAHVVQQREGVAFLKDGVSEAGDPYEQHADAVAHAVVRGESAEPLLDRGPGGGGGAPVQRTPRGEVGHGQSPAPRPAAPLAGAAVSTDPRVNEIATLHPRGIAMALYGQYPEGTRGRAEFVAQGRAAAASHHTVADVGGGIEIGRAIPIHDRNDIRDHVNRTHEVLAARYRASRVAGGPDDPPFLKVADLSIFCHGLRASLNLPGEDLTRGNVAETLASMSGALHAGVDVQLFACSAAGGDHSLAATMADALGDQASVFGHTTSGHATRNSAARGFGAVAGGAEGGIAMQDVVFPPRFVDAELTRIWGPVAPSDRAALRAGLEAQLHGFYRMLAASRGGDPEVRQAMIAELTPGESVSTFGREMFIDPERTAALAQRHFPRWVSRHLDAFEALHPVTAAARAASAVPHAIGAADGGIGAQARSDAEGHPARPPATHHPATTEAPHHPATIGAPHHPATTEAPHHPATAGAPPHDPQAERVAATLAAIQQTLPELAERAPELRGHEPALTDEARAFRVPHGGWRDRSRGHDRVMELSSALRGFVENVQRDPAALAHIRETLDLFYDDPDPHARLTPADIDLPLVLAIASRESGAHRDLLLSRSDHQVVTAGRDTHRDGVGGLDFAADHLDQFPSQIRGHVTATQGNARLEAGLRSGRGNRNPAELRERDLLAAYVLEVHQRRLRFEHYVRVHADFLSRAQVDQLLAALSTDARRAWTQAAFGSRLDDLARDALARFHQAVRGGSFETALADDQVNLDSIVTDDRVMAVAGLSGHRTRLSAAEAWLVERSLPPDLAAPAAARAVAAADAAVTP